MPCSQEFLPVPTQSSWLLSTLTREGESWLIIDVCLPSSIYTPLWVNLSKSSDNFLFASGSGRVFFHERHGAYMVSTWFVYLGMWKFFNNTAEPRYHGDLQPTEPSWWERCRASRRPKIFVVTFRGMGVEVTKSSDKKHQDHDHNITYVYMYHLSGQIFTVMALNPHCFREFLDGDCLILNHHVRGDYSAVWSL